MSFSVKIEWLNEQGEPEYTSASKCDDLQEVRSFIGGQINKLIAVPGAHLMWYVRRDDEFAAFRYHMLGAAAYDAAGTPLDVKATVSVLLRRPNRKTANTVPLMRICTTSL